MAIRHLLFEAGGLALAAPAELISSVHEQLRVQPVSGTQRWFRGLAVAHGKLLPVTDLGAFSGRRSSTGHTLELTESIGKGGLQVDTVFGLSATPLSEVPLDQEDAVFSSDGNLALTTQAVVQQDRVHRLLDIAALLQSPVFLNIAETDN
ncbi:chemotaxis protein CheW [Granulosicoccus sp. 3-233]|uniref:chemotaxis protein CheW n=1 Tax=Granulosicoccus sp. 3-233 TaxID=3417969 RepID=UPI003D3253F8